MTCTDTKTLSHTHVGTHTCAHIDIKMADREAGSAWVELGHLSNHQSSSSGSNSRRCHRHKHDCSTSLVEASGLPLASCLARELRSYILNCKTAKYTRLARARERESERKRERARARGRDTHTDRQTDTLHMSFSQISFRASNGPVEPRFICYMKNK